MAEAARATPSIGAGITAPQASAVAWGAIIAGAVAVIATTVVLLALGTGLGFTAASPWREEGLSAKTIGIAAAIWLVVVQWLSAALGGFLTGRLRVRWNYLDSDEVFFRDTAHGFLAWALAVAITALTAATLTAGVVGIGVGGAAAGGAAGATANGNDASLSYYTDTLYRTVGAGPVNPESPEAYRTETARILARGLSSEMSIDDETYLAQQVAARTGLTEDEARRRVETVVTQAKEAADTARKAAASLAIATALSLAIGAFIAAVAAGIGGRARDD